MTRLLYLFTILLATALHATANYPTWRAQNFVEPDLSNETVSGPEADPDSDNLPNLYEYASGTNPHQPNTLDSRL